MKKVQLELWTTFDKLCLISAITKLKTSFADQNWVTISRYTKQLHETISSLIEYDKRNDEWYSAKQCAAQYESLLKSLGARKKKRIDRNTDYSDVHEALLTSLTNDFCEELQQSLVDIREDYTKTKKLSEEIDIGKIEDEKLEELYMEIIDKEKSSDIKSKLKSMLDEKNANENENSSKSLLLQTLTPNEPPSSEQKTTNITTSPLLTSLLQSPSPLVRSSPSTSSPTISLLLHSSPPVSMADSTLSKLLETPTSLPATTSVATVESPSFLYPASGVDSQSNLSLTAEGEEVLVQRVIKETEEYEKEEEIFDDMSDLEQGVVENEIIIENESSPIKRLTPRRLDMEQIEDDEPEEEILETVEEIIERVEEAIIETVGENNLNELVLSEGIDTVSISDEEIGNINIEDNTYEVIVVGAQEMVEQTQPAISDDSVILEDHNNKMENAKENINNEKGLETPITEPGSPLVDDTVSNEDKTSNQAVESLDFKGPGEEESSSKDETVNETSKESDLDNLHASNIENEVDDAIPIEEKISNQGVELVTIGPREEESVSKDGTENETSTEIENETSKDNENETFKETENEMLEVTENEISKELENETSKETENVTSKEMEKEISKETESEKSKETDLDCPLMTSITEKGVEDVVEIEDKISNQAVGSVGSGLREEDSLSKDKPENDASKETDHPSTTLIIEKEVEEIILSDSVNSNQAMEPLNITSSHEGRMDNIEISSESELDKSVPEVIELTQTTVSDESVIVVEEVPVTIIDDSEDDDNQEKRINRNKTVDNVSLRKKGPTSKSKVGNKTSSKELVVLSESNSEEMVEISSSEEVLRPGTDSSSCRSVIIADDEMNIDEDNPVANDHQTSESVQTVNTISDKGVISDNNDEVNQEQEETERRFVEVSDDSDSNDKSDSSEETEDNSLLTTEDSKDGLDDSLKFSSLETLNSVDSPPDPDPRFAGLRHKEIELKKTVRKGIEELKSKGAELALVHSRSREERSKHMKTGRKRSKSGTIKEKVSQNKHVSHRKLNKDQNMKEKVVRSKSSKERLNKKKYADERLIELRRKARIQMGSLDSKPDSPSLSTASSDEDRDYKSWKKSILLVYNRLASHKFASLFSKPITDNEAPGYHKIILRPIDLSTIKRNIENGIIRTTVEFQRDMLLMVQNAIIYNKFDTPVFDMAKAMGDDMLAQMEVMVQALGDGVPLIGDTREEKQITRARTSKSSVDAPQNKKKKNQESDESRPKRSKSLIS